MTKVHANESQELDCCELKTITTNSMIDAKLDCTKLVIKMEFSLRQMPFIVPKMSLAKMPLLKCPHSNRKSQTKVAM